MFDVTISRGRAESIRLTLSRNSGLGQLDSGDSARLIVYLGSTELLNVTTDTATDDGSTLAVENGLPTPGDEAAQLLLKLTAAETNEWPVGTLSAELLVTDATDSREYRVQDGRIFVQQSASVGGVLAPIVGYHELITLVGGITTDDDRQVLQSVQSIVEGQIRDYLNWDVTQGTHVELHPAIDRVDQVHPLLLLNETHRPNLAAQFNGLNVVTLSKGYVRSITSVIIDETANTASDFSGGIPISSEEYQLDTDFVDSDGNETSVSGMLIRRWANWPVRARSMQVTYLSGFTDLELATRYPDIKGAVAEEIAGRMAAAKKLVDSAGEFPVSGFSFGGYSEQYDVSDKNALSIVRGQLSGAAKAQLSKYKHLKLGA